MRTSVILSLLCGVLSSCVARAEPPVYPVKGAPPTKWVFLDEVRKRVRPLKHPRGKRRPMILWECVSFEPQGPQVYKDLLARGLTQHIRMDVKMIPTALALQKAGSPVMMMRGAGGTWPYQLAGKPAAWAHQYDAGYTPTRGRGRACTSILAGWQVAANHVRQTLRKFKQAGVTVDAVWMDWEGEPLGGGRGYQNARHCKRCRKLVPARAMANRANYAAYCWRLYLELTGTYLSAPVREVFPACSTTNWEAIYSSAERPTHSHWRDYMMPACTPHSFTGTNPIAYGNNIFFRLAWKDSYPLDREHVDQLYTHLLIRQVSDSAANAMKFAPETDSFPWVIRWCPDISDAKIPIMSRPRYREVLRHLWLRGADGMQIFNASRKGYEEIVINEVVDAVAIYDEMLGYREFLDAGEILCTDVPKVQDDGVLWSGLRLTDRAVVRVFKQGGGAAKVTIEPWPGRPVTLGVPADGKTYVVTTDGKTARVAP